MLLLLLLSSLECLLRVDEEVKNAGWSDDVDGGEDGDDDLWGRIGSIMER